MQQNWPNRRMTPMDYCAASLEYLPADRGDDRRLFSNIWARVGFTDSSGHPDSAAFKRSKRCFTHEDFRIGQRLAFIPDARHGPIRATDPEPLRLTIAL